MSELRLKRLLRAEAEISQEAKQALVVTDDMIFTDLAVQIVRKMTMDELRQLHNMEFSKWDPRDEESRTRDNAELMDLLQLRGTVRYEVRLKLI